MTIIRAPRKERNFTILSNEVCRDTRLSMKALGLLIRLLSRPDNWNTNSESLAREFAVGRDQIRTVMNELSEFGYLQLVKKQDAAGHWNSTWYVYDEPHDFNIIIEPKPEKPVVGKPSSGESGANTRTDLTSTDNKLTLIDVRQENVMFESFWKAYPRKTNKAFAKKCFDKVKVDEELLNKILKAIEQQKKSEQWKNPQYIPHPSSWLNGERWEDEVTLPKTGLTDYNKLRML